MYSYQKTPLWILPDGRRGNDATSRRDHANAGTAIDAADSLVALDEVRVQYLGKKGELTAQLQS
ncbi:phenylalanyl-tRNA synthetase alpha chain [Vibrio variabilis]|nr:phenylalanyl-tRNA synthetase alpha chain [Vibrio variabilis]